MINFQKLTYLFEQHADVSISLKQEAYLKQQFKCYGIKSPVRRALYHSFIKATKKIGTIDWDLLNLCWESAYREHHHFVLDYLLAMKNKLRFEDVGRLEHFARHQQWWDSIDVLTKIIGSLALRDERLIPILENWAVDANFWMRRLAMEHQLGYKDKTDTERLEKMILANLGSREFFINKAIGWILRDYSKTNPIWVADFLQRFSSDMAPLSVREASKYL